MQGSGASVTCLYLVRRRVRSVSWVSSAWVLKLLRVLLVRVWVISVFSSLSVVLGGRIELGTVLVWACRLGLIVRFCRSVWRIRRKISVFLSNVRCSVLLRRKTLVLWVSECRLVSSLFYSWCVLY